jgi:hypothetical protein
LLEAYLSQAGLGAHFEVDIDPAQGENPDTRQFLVTIRNPPAITSGGSPVVPPPYRFGAEHTAPVVVPAAPPAQPVLTVLEGFTSDFLASDLAFADGPKGSAAYYRLLQPPVQKLRDIPIFEERAILGQKLAYQGMLSIRRSWSTDGTATR